MLSFFTFVATLSSALITPAHATFTPQLPRGKQIVQRSLGEVCIVPKKLATAVYSEKDIKNELALCESDVNGATQNVAACGKTTSTNPAVEFFAPAAGQTPAQAEAKQCVGSEKLAKFKLSTSCSYTPSILSYYHLSRYLGHVNQVPVAVLRTLDMERNKAIGNKTLGYLKSKNQLGETIAQTWQSLLMYLNQGAASKKKDQLMTDDLKQSYGALSKNPKGDEYYKEMFNGGANQASRAINFRDRNPTFQLLKKSAPVKSFLGEKFDQATLQKVVQMKNVSDMVVMDTILSQEDRFGNLDYTEVFFYFENGQVLKAGNLKPEEVKTKGAIKVKEMLMKDNDCGVNRLNHIKAARLLQALTHISPVTYSQIQKLTALLETEETKTFFRRETMMNEKDFEMFKFNVKEAAAALKASCLKGSLKLDLDLDLVFANKALTTSCD